MGRRGPGAASGQRGRGRGRGRGGRGGARAATDAFDIKGEQLVLNLGDQKQLGRLRREVAKLGKCDNPSVAAR